MEKTFFTFIRPYLAYIDNGDLFRKPFSWVYIFAALANLVFPVYVLYAAISNGIFRANAKFVIVFCLVWLITAFAGWISFQLWWDRRDKVNNIAKENDEFVATPIFAHFVQTAGEWIGIWIALVGFGSALLTTIILGKESFYFSHQIGMGFFKTGLINIILMPVTGFLIVVFSRFVSEQFKALAAIANNTKK